MRTYEYNTENVSRLSSPTPYSSQMIFILVHIQTWYLKTHQKLETTRG